MNSAYRVAIVGCGEISKVHASAWQNLPELDLIAACDIKLESLASFAKAFWGCAYLQGRENDA